MATKSLDERLEELNNRRDYVGQQFNSADVKTLVEGIRDAREKGGTPIKGATATELQPDETPIAEMTSDGTLVLGIPKGQKGDDGKQGDPGEQGKSAYQVWLDEGNEGSEVDFLNSLKAHVSRFIPIATVADATSLDVGDTYAFSNVPNPTDGAMLLMPNGDTTTPKTLMFSVTSNGDTPETFTYTYVGELSISTEGFLSTDKIVQNLNTGGLNNVPSAEAVKGLNARLYGSDEEVVGEPISISSVMSGIFINQETNAWLGGSGVGARKSKRITIPDGTSLLRFTVQTGYSRKALYTFTKKTMPASNLSFNQLVSDDYLCNDVASYTDILKGNYSSGDEVELQVPFGANYLYFVSTDSSGNSHPVPLTATPVQITHAGGDIDNLNLSALSIVGANDDLKRLKTVVDVPYNEVDCEYELSDGYVNGITGVVTSHSTLRHVETTVSGISRLKFLGYELTSYTGAPGYAFYDENDTPISYAKYDVNLDANTRGAKVYIVDVPDGAVTFKCTIGSFNSESFFIKEIEGDTVTEWVSKENLLVTTKIKKETIKKSYLWDSLVNGSVLKSDGTLQSGLSETQYGYTQDIIAVKPGDVLTAYFYYINESGAEVVATNITDIIRSVCCYRNNEVMSGGFTVWTVQTQTTVKTSAYTVPFGCDGVKITFGGAHSGFTRVKLLIERQGEKEFFQKLPNNDNYDQQLTVAAMEAGVKYPLPYADVWSNKVIVFSAKVTRDAENGIGTLTIGNTRLRTATWGSNPASITINDTTITTTSGISEKQNGSWQHGLTINNDIQVIIETDRSYNQLVKITLRSNGQEDYVISGDDFIQPYTDTSFTPPKTTNVRKKWGQVSGARYAQASISGVFSEVSFSNIFKDLLSPVWIFGDSYCSNNGDSRWVYWAEEANVKNYLLSSFAGATSEDQIVSFRSLIAIHRPKVVCWFLGMNDPDSTGSTQSGTPDSSWLSCVKEVIETCDRYGVQVVLATIPSVQNPTGYGPGGIYSNKAKNDWVRASGKRFYDEEAAVGATSDGWWIGVSVNSYGSNAYKETAPLRETTDNPPFGVHPSTKGAKALFTRLLADVPEIMFKD